MKPSRAIYPEEIGMVNIETYKSKPSELIPVKTAILEGKMAAKSNNSSNLIILQAELNIELSQLQKAKANMKKKASPEEIDDINIQIKEKIAFIEGIHQKLLSA
jgi:hypothetical protein